MNIIHNIFSVKNENSHKVVRICFIKLKLKNYKKIAANLKNSNLKLANDNKKLKNANIKLKTGSEKLKIKNKEYLEAIKTNPEMFEIYVKNPELAKKDEINAPMVREQIQEILNREEFPLFQLVEIETMNRCNGECAFCPVNRHDDPREFKMMEDKLFYNIISQLKELNFKGRVCPFSNNEPLMDKRIFEFTDYIRKELPECHISLFTNGKLLNLEKFNKLIPNCDTFCIDIYYKGKEEIPQNIKPVVDLCRENKKLQNIVKVQFVNQDAVRNNRGGGSKNRHNIYKLQTPCLLPYKQVIIRPDGKLSLCCNDATGKFSMGDLTKNTLKDIWHSEYYQEIREQLKYDRTKIKMCEYCDNFGGFGTNESPDFVFKQNQFKKSWEYIENTYYKNE